MHSGTTCILWESLKQAPSGFNDQFPTWLYIRTNLFTLKDPKLWKIRSLFLLEITFTFFGYLNSILLPGKWSLSLLACTHAFVELVDLIVYFLFSQAHSFVSELLFLLLYCLGDLGFLLRLCLSIVRVVKTFFFFNCYTCGFCALVLHW